MTNVSERVKKALLDKGWTQKKLCGEIDVTETGFRRMAENNSWKLETLEKMASALGKSIVYFVAEEEKNDDTIKKSLPEGDYLSEFLQKMEENFASLTSELAVKNQQIAGLQRTVDALVGKSEGVTSLPLSSNREFEQIMREYKGAVYGQPEFAPLIRNLFDAKLVAPRSFV